MNDIIIIIFLLIASQYMLDTLNSTTWSRSRQLAHKSLSLSRARWNLSTSQPVSNSNGWPWDDWPGGGRTYAQFECVCWSLSNNKQEISLHKKSHHLRQHNPVFSLAIKAFGEGLIVTLPTRGYTHGHLQMMPLSWKNIGRSLFWTLSAPITMFSSAFPFINQLITLLF